MSKATSPTRFNGDRDHFYDPTFTQEISQKMRVPKRIKVDGETEDIISNNLPPSSWQQNDKFDMHVPDRILVIDNIYMDLTQDSKRGYSGQDQHFGTRAPPRELQLENSVMPPDPGVVRVQTPPRVIKLDEHYFPSADDEFAPQQLPMEPLPVSRVDQSKAMDVSVDQRSAALAQRELYSVEGMSTAEEVVHLRRQLAKLNRRVMAMELHSQQQWNREKILYFSVAAYFLLKGLVWLNH
ncbi:transport and Golgi organization protein 11-like isoform X1 [Macrosteles quadrilineatus]|uniref:transport and Golgi organization protein 11-like isoform X1 n=1 Tax=Macrosteles quadrilineatus TaxID=74068 RepID=UPI0023E34AE7|nr:transport and Golgi organization protein 11-like isoform X1 [Macrosteles quadrilineatus]